MSRHIKIDRDDRILGLTPDPEGRGWMIVNDPDGRELGSLSLASSGKWYATIHMSRAEPLVGSGPLRSDELALDWLRAMDQDRKLVEAHETLRRKAVYQR